MGGDSSVLGEDSMWEQGDGEMAVLAHEVVMSFGLARGLWW